MTREPAWRRYLRFWGPDLRRDVDDELVFHVESRTDELVAAGMAQDEARAEALRRFGRVSDVREACRDIDERRLRREGRTTWWTGLWHDVVVALRGLRRTPAFTAAAIITLVLGIGANTAIFSVVNGVLLRPLPFPEPERIVQVFIRMPGINIERGDISGPEFLDFTGATRAFSHLAASDGETLTLTGAGEPVVVRALGVTASFFPLFGLSPELGRAFGPDEDRPGAARVVVLGHDYWRGRLGGDSAAIGRTISLDGVPHTTIGVMPPDFRFGDADVYVPLALDPADPRGRGSHYLDVFGRLRPGAALAGAQAELAGIAERQRRDFPDSYARNLGYDAFAVPLQEVWVGDVRRMLLVLLGAVGLVLLIACTNVANLLLVRAEARQREIAVRAALGAGRGRIVRQLLVESGLIAAAGTVGGLLLAGWGVPVLLALEPGGLPRAAEVAVDRTVALVMLGVALLTGLLFGLVPALHASAPDLQHALKEGARGSGAAGQRRLQRILVVAEVALAVVVVIGAGLLARSFWRLQQVDVGIRVDNAMTARLSLPDVRYDRPEKVTGFYRELVDRLAALPGVQGAAASSGEPLAGAGGNWDVQVEDRPTRPGDPDLSPDFGFVAGDYFRVMGIPVRAGRALERRDDVTNPPVVVVNEALARTVWPHEQAVGKRIRLAAGPNRPPLPWMTVVGVVADTRASGPGSEPRPGYFIAHQQTPAIFGDAVTHMSLVVRTHGDPRAMVRAVQQAVWALDRELGLEGVQTLGDAFDASVARPRFTMLVLGVFGGVALLLAAVGVYGVMAYAVAQRTRELGIRLALGARPAQVRAEVIRQGVGLAALGIVAGLALAAVTGRVIESLLYGVQPTDPLTYAAIAAVLALVALVASYLPARAATRVDPMEALRAE